MGRVVNVTLMNLQFIKNNIGSFFFLYYYYLIVNEVK